MSVRKFRPDPIPEDTINKIFEVARWAMSGANSQPWEFVVVTDPKIKKELRDAYSEYNTDFIFWMEQQREYSLRHPSYQVKNDPHESLRFNKAKANWHQAPAVIVVLGDGRRQWGTVMGAHTFGRDQSHLTDSLANASFLHPSGGGVFGSHFGVGVDPHRRAAQTNSRRARSLEALL